MKTFKPYTPNQIYLLPPNVADWLPAGHLAPFISDVVDQLDLKLIYASYAEGGDRGQPPYHPAMMLKLLVYAYCVGKPSSRKIEKATWEEVAYRVLSADQHPDHDSIAEFRKRHLKVFSCLFLQVLRLCREAGLVKLGHVALDGTKVKANASKHKAMSYDRMGKAEAELEKEIEELLRRAEETDAEEDAKYGKGRQGDELPEELRGRESRLERIKAAKAALEARAEEEAKVKAKEVRGELKERKQKEKETTVRGRPPKDLSIADGMRRKLRTKAGQEVYRFRKAIVEPVFGQIKEVRSFRRFSLRGLIKVEAEWTLVCLTHNLLKLFRSGWLPQGA